MLCINKLLREGLLGSSMEEQLKYITECASTADGMTRKHAKLCFLLCFMVAQTKTPNRSHIKRKSCRDGVVYGRDNLDKFVKGTLLLCRKFPVEKTVDFDELQTQLRVLRKEVSISVAEVLQCLVKWENRCIKSAGTADPSFSRNGLEKVCDSERSFSRCHVGFFFRGQVNFVAVNDVIMQTTKRKRKGKTDVMRKTEILTFSLLQKVVS